MTALRKQLVDLSNTLPEQQLEPAIAYLRLLTGKSEIGGDSLDDEWDGESETQLIMSIPGLYESIIEASKEPFEECATLEDIGWRTK